MLAGCKCKNITEYYGAIMKPGTTELLIVLELMSCSVADLVGVPAPPVIHLSMQRHGRSVARQHSG